MKTARPRKPAAVATASPKPATAPRRTAGTDPLAALRQSADKSPAVSQLQTLQRRATAVVQREVDTSSSPFLPDYDADETPAWDDSDKGLDPWTITEYLGTEVAVMCSIADKKIGSVYFTDGRARSTHPSGAKSSPHDPASSRQFHVDWTAAVTQFKSEHPGHLKKVGKKQYVHDLRRWVAAQVTGADIDPKPTWFLSEITGPEDAYTSPEDAPQPGAKLFEVFFDDKNAVSNTHPSRGVAVKYNLTREEIMHIRAAAKVADAAKGARRKNAAFYAYVIQHVPRLAGDIRKPSDIKYR
ncbi:hypothetical protein KX928_19080 [Roseobacter sp. YSTF-M11]|uniref:Uncharacterized protein n=1 Tax=Roseobacter insulae TaxID=2859783 RepID=A0A9X1JZY5_9RHOB|nr:hypothetical protein [Roseobacter insulae]MBW4709891.1 hypothetical protein [Roseobacter insulae]